jgi:hypothetical protein
LLAALKAKYFASKSCEPSAYGCIDPLGIISEDLVKGWDAPNYGTTMKIRCRG